MVQKPGRRDHLGRKPPIGGIRRNQRSDADDSRAIRRGRRKQPLVFSNPGDELPFRRADFSGECSCGFALRQRDHFSAPAPISPGPVLRACTTAVRMNIAPSSASPAEAPVAAGRLPTISATPARNRRKMPRVRSIRTSFRPMATGSGANRISDDAREDARPISVAIAGSINSRRSVADRSGLR